MGAGFSSHDVPSFPTTNNPVTSTSWRSDVDGRGYYWWARRSSETKRCGVFVNNRINKLTEIPKSSRAKSRFISD
ncbi:hypothetical protein EPR50_G00090330 [Perca flavescens]|uniref:Uncharacterized protein n=1 Tax=Perca flavescens TaxID=8167 RepID=A0A484D3M5_PERFV|nr:hypothetical protein EPR50_G00090330 [Perca flavescens]